MKGKFFVGRAIISTFCGAFLDTSIFFCILFWNIMGPLPAFKMILILTIAKVIYEIALLPITIRIIGFLKAKENVDVYESPEFNNIISFTNKISHYAIRR